MRGFTQGLAFGPDRSTEFAPQRGSRDSLQCAVAHITSLESRGPDVPLGLGTRQHDACSGSWKDIQSALQIQDLDDDVNTDSDAQPATS
jgi:hypothetical protein